MIAGVSQQQSVGGIDDIGRSQAVVNEARGFADVFGEVGGKRDDVVVGRFLDLVDALD